MEPVFLFFAGFTWLLKAFSCLGFLAGLAAASFLIAAGVIGLIKKMLYGTKETKSLWLIPAGLWLYMACFLRPEGDFLVLAMKQATFVAYGMVIFYDSAKTRSESRLKKLTLVIGFLMLTQPINAIWVWVCRI